MSYGFKTLVTVNSHICPVVIDNGDSVQIPGGLLKGDNSIHIEVRAGSANVLADVLVTVRTLQEGSEVELYRYAPDTPQAADLKGTFSHKE